MEMTKKEQEEVTVIYDTWLNSYLTGDVETYNSFFDDRYHFIGSTDNEDFLDRRETTKFLKETADQLAGKVEIRNNRRIIEKFEGLIFVTELFDAYFLIESEWTYYGKFRFTSALIKNKEGWRFIYQHFSTPDLKAQEGETIGTEKIAAENQMLREAVKRRTVELEQKNHELEIESALERVRARTMAMQKSEELPQAANLLFQQVQSLGMPAWSAGYCLWDEDKKAITLFMSSEGVIQPALRMPLTEDPSLIHFKEAYERGESFYVEELGGEALKEHYKYLRTLPGVKESLEDIERAGFPVPTFQIFHVPYFSKGFLLFITYEPVPEAHEIFKRFAGVFEQTYTRFLDLRKAEEQTRESQIQLSLERVRTRSMAMNSSEELSDVLSVLFEQFDILGIKPSFAHLTLFDEENDTFSFRMTGLAGQRILVEQIIDINKVEAWQSSYQQWKEGDKNRINCIDYPPEALPQIWEIMAEIFDALPEGSKMQIEDFPNGIYTTQGHCKFGYLGFNHTRKATEEEKTIVIRFATEFGRLYQRYLDIQKAEAQARESQIQLSLERVRARAMAMQNSEELNEVLSILFNQYDILGINPKFAFLTLMDITNNTFGLRITGKKGYRNIGQQTISLDAMDLWVDTVERWKNSVSHTHQNLIYPPESIPQLFEVLSGVIESVPEEARFQIEDFPDGLYSCEGHCKFGYIGFANSRKVSDEEVDIVIRFAKEFEQVYQRFLDLQKAEAQAREAQIEAALERIRNRALIMKDSSELNEVVSVFFNEFSQLDLLPPEARTYFCHIDTNKNEAEVWMTYTNGEVMSSSHITPLTKSASMKKYYEAWKRKDPICIRAYKGKNLDSYISFVSSLPHVKKDKDYKKLFKNPPKQIFMTDANFLQGNIGIMSFDPLSEEALEVLQRFAKVFEFTYTRFLDLKKAEAQAREAQIEAALERVRARTMAMQQSNELTDAAALVFQQIEELGIHQWGNAFQLWDEDMKSVNSWTATSGVESLKSIIPATEDPIMINILKAAKQGEDLYVEAMGGKALENHYKYLTQLPVLKEVFEGLAEDGIHPPKFQVFHAAYFSHGYILFITHEENPAAHNIFKRFAKIFEQTYTRFLDLKNAEAQAREAQIEAALERVRARTMAMHKSDDLLDSAALMFQQLQELGGNLFACGFVLVDKDKPDSELWMSAEGKFQPPITIPNETEPVTGNMFKAWKEGSKLYIEEAGGEALAAHYDCLLSIPKTGDVFQGMLDAGISFPTWQRWHGASFTYGYLLIITTKPFEDVNLFVRFAKVFDQTYTRFLDLQKAEEQAREAEIEASLERIRSRTMGMQSSDELAEVGSLVFQQMKELGIQAVSSWFWFIDKTKDEIEIWTTHDVQLSKPVKVKAKDYWTFKKEIEAWKKKEPFYKLKLPQNDFVHILKEIFGIKIKQQKGVEHIHLLQTYHKFGFLGLGTKTEATKQEMEISARFAKVFEQTYTRFLDLKKAEAQARESQIEAALERVRARSMAMHNSEELLDVAQQLYQELENLGVPQYMTGFVEVDKANQKQKVWVTAPNGERIESFFLPLKGDSILKTRYNSWVKQEPIFYQKVSGDTLKKHLSYVSRHYESAEAVEIGNQFPDTIIFYCGNFSEGYLHILSEVKLDKEQESILQKFTKVFSITYRRFLDLKLAEEQAREAQIEAGLERVRAKTMAMHRSEELAETASVLFNELKKLGIESIRSGVGIIDYEADTAELWLVTETDGKAERKILGKINAAIHPLYRKWFDAGRKNMPYFIEEMEGDTLRNYYETVSAYWQLPIPAEFNHKEVYHGFFFPEGTINVITLKRLSEAECNTLVRFAKVFGLLYRRFLDLQNAEAQAREAKVEAALERVRARTMAMHKGDELADTAKLLFDQITGLGIKPRSCGFLIMNNETKTMEDWSANLDENGKASIVLGTLQYDQHPIISEVVATWKRGDPYFIGDIHGEDLQKYYQMITLQESTSKAIQDKVLANSTSEYTNSFNFNYGMMYVLTPQPINEVEINTLLRFASVFKLTYRRFLDLQKAEKQAYEAIKQASIDRVRGEIASMRTSNDLERITPLIWAELINLNVPFIRCGVFIMDEDQKIIHNYLSTPDGKAIASFHLPYNTPGFVAKVLSHWKKKKMYLEHWDKKAMTDFAHVLVKQGIFTSPDQYLNTLPKKGFYLHLLPFQQGMLYVGNLSRLENGELDLLQSLANAFSTAYARYDDFNKLEMAKKQVDKALVDLKQAQQQLVQSEKMASLGELTAGIAHEIQNPLNFVNNFSEVNKELITELEEAILEGDYEEVKAIANDISNNQEKINHHGKRAEGIVKGMLQHSRSSSGQKELTDINVLCDEYLRLAYHGLRAKDKSFKSDFKINLDENLPKINVAGQDIGRVILNLINNAFYAVSQKSKENQEGYAPEVMVSTRKDGEKVDIRVKDNGNGIPKSSLDKIFQPFFTTKPTGEGTGLGLSISYDIITKGHGGQLEVETQEGEGTEFKIIIPINKNA